uniref:Protein phosphatase 1 regulatory inhibitor subunit 14C n=1 Tax=Malurus cyaneus samueli TaxID=2593467 RepID=A0A8C5T2C3_9PASS
RAPFGSAGAAAERSMSVATGGSEAAAAAGGGGGNRVFFQSPRGGLGVGSGGSGKVTVKYDRKELRKRLVLEEWIVEQLGQLYGCEEEEMPDVEIDIDDLLDAANEEERALKLQKLEPIKKFKERVRWSGTGISREVQKLSAEITQFKPAL